MVGCREFTVRIGRAVIQVMLLIFFVGNLAISVNAWRSKPLPLVADWSAQKNQALSRGETPTIPWEEAKEAWLMAAAVFVDARPSEQFVLGHIEGARNLPWEAFDQKFPQVFADIPKDRLVIAYCDGEGCNLSHELAAGLRGKGYSHVRVLANGWSAWQMAKMPTETGPGTHPPGPPPVDRSAPQTPDR